MTDFKRGDIVICARHPKNRYLNRRGKVLRVHIYVEDDGETWSSLSVLWDGNKCPTSEFPWGLAHEGRMREFMAGELQRMDIA